MMEWTEEKILEYVQQGWTLSWDRTNQKYKLQKRINGKVKSYTLPRRFNEFCKRLKGESKYLPIFEDIEKEQSITKAMEKHYLDEDKIYEVLERYVEWKLDRGEVKDLISRILFETKVLEDGLIRISRAVRAILKALG